MGRELLLEKLPRDLAKAFRSDEFKSGSTLPAGVPRYYPYNGYGDIKNRVSDVSIDFENATYKKITPEEALQQYQNDNGANVLAIINGNLSCLYKDGGKKKYRFTTDISNLNIHKKTGTLVTDSKDLTPEALYANAEAIYLVVNEPTLDPAKIASRRENPESKYFGRAWHRVNGVYTYDSPANRPLPPIGVQQDGYLGNDLYTNKKHDKLKLNDWLIQDFYYDDISDTGSYTPGARYNYKEHLRTTRFYPLEIFERVLADFDAVSRKSMSKMSRYQNNWEDQWSQFKKKIEAAVRILKNPMSADYALRDYYINARINNRYASLRAELAKNREWLIKANARKKELIAEIANAEAERDEKTDPNTLKQKEDQYRQVLDVWKANLEDLLKAIFDKEAALENLQAENDAIRANYDATIADLRTKYDDVIASIDDYVSKFKKKNLTESLPRDLANAFKSLDWRKGIPENSKFYDEPDYGLDYRGYGNIKASDANAVVPTRATIDFENSTYTPISPEEAMEQFNAGNGDKVFAIADGQLNIIRKSPSGTFVVYDHCSVAPPYGRGNTGYNNPVYYNDDTHAWQKTTEGMPPEMLYRKAEKIYLADEVPNDKHLDRGDYVNSRYAGWAAPYRIDRKQEAPYLGLYNGDSNDPDDFWIYDNYTKAEGNLYVVPEIEDLKELTNGQGMPGIGADHYWTGDENDVGYPEAGYGYPLPVWEWLLDVLKKGGTLYSGSIKAVEHIIEILKAGKNAVGDPRHQNWNAYDNIKKSKAYARNYDVYRALRATMDDARALLDALRHTKKRLKNYEDEKASQTEPSVLDARRSQKKDEIAVDRRKLEEILKHLFDLESDLEVIGTDDDKELAGINSDIKFAKEHINDIKAQIKKLYPKFKFNEGLLLEKLPKDLSRALRQIRVGFSGNPRVRGSFKDDKFSTGSYGNISHITGGVDHPVEIDFENSTYTEITPEQALDYFYKGEGQKVFALLNGQLAVKHLGNNGPKNDIVAYNPEITTDEWKDTENLEPEEMYDLAEKIYYVEEVPANKALQDKRREDSNSRYFKDRTWSSKWDYSTGVHDYSLEQMKHPRFAGMEDLMYDPLAEETYFEFNDDYTKVAYMSDYIEDLQEVPGFNDFGDWTGDPEDLGTPRRDTFYPLDAWEQIAKAAYDHWQNDEDSDVRCAREIVRMLKKGKKALLGDPEEYDWSDYESRKTDMASQRYYDLEKYYQEDLTRAKILLDQAKEEKQRYANALDYDNAVSSQEGISTRRKSIERSMSMLENKINDLLKNLFDDQERLRVVGTDDDPLMMDAKKDLTAAETNLHKTLSEIQSIKDKLANRRNKNG